jgi:hypothetical protein
MLSTCCRDCEKRIIGCHSICEDYKQYQDELQKVKQRRKDTELLNKAEPAKVPNIIIRFKN